MANGEAKTPFVVYEIQVSKPRREREPVELGDRKLPVRHTVSPIGCFFAADEEAACRAAAQSEGRLGHYVATRATYMPVVFAARPPAPQELDELANPAPRKARADEGAAEA